MIHIFEMMTLIMTLLVTLFHHSYSYHIPSCQKSLPSHKNHSIFPKSQRSYKIRAIEFWGIINKEGRIIFKFYRHFDDLFYSNIATINSFHFITYSTIYPCQKMQFWGTTSLPQWALLSYMSGMEQNSLVPIHKSKISCKTQDGFIFLKSLMIMKLKSLENFPWCSMFWRPKLEI